MGLGGYQALSSYSSWFTQRVDVGDPLLCSLSQDELHGPIKKNVLKRKFLREESASESSKPNFA